MKGNLLNIDLLLSHLISSQSLNLGGRRGTTDDIKTIPFHPSLSFAALRESPNLIPIHSLMLSSHLFICLPLLLAPFTVPSRIVFAVPKDLEMWPYHLSFCFCTMVLQLHSGFCANLLVCHMIFVGNVQKSPIVSHLKGLDSSLHFYCQGSALKGIKEGRWDERPRQLNLKSKRDVLVPPYIFSLERAAIVWAILERISGFDPSLEKIAPRYLKFSTSSSLWPFISTFL